MDDLIVLLKVLDLLHDLFENFGAVLWRIAVFYKADLDLQLQLIADVLIVQPVSKRRFGVDNLFDLLRQSLALVVDDSTINLFIGSVYVLKETFWLPFLLSAFSSSKDAKTYSAPFASAR